MSDDEREAGFAAAPGGEGAQDEPRDYHVRWQGWVLFVRG